MPPEIEEKRKNRIVLEKFAEKTAIFQRTFGCSDGKKVLDELKQLSMGGFNADPYIHAYNAGKMFIYQFIVDCIENKYYERAKALMAKEEANE
jgi:hypothetical protein